MAIGIAYVDGPRLARSMYAAADWVHAGREEINRLNGFPVPDGDTPWARPPRSRLGPPSWEPGATRA